MVVIEFETFYFIGRERLFILNSVVESINSSLVVKEETRVAFPVSLPCSLVLIRNQTFFLFFKQPWVLLPEWWMAERVFSVVLCLVESDTVLKSHNSSRYSVYLRKDNIISIHPCDKFLLFGLWCCSGWSLSFYVNNKFELAWRNMKKT